MSAPNLISPTTLSGGTPVGGTGNPDTIPRWTGPSTLGDSGLIDDGTQVYTTTRKWGVGTATPSSPGTIQGTYSATVPQLLVRDSAGASGAVWVTSNNSTLTGTIRVGPVSGGYGFAVYDSFSHTFRESGNHAMTILNGGNVGIGTASPTSTTDIWGLQANTGATSASAPTGTMRVAYAGAAAAGNFGSSVVFTQRWASANAQQVAVGQITGVKIAGDGNYGGGLAFFTSNGTGNDLAERARIDSAGRILQGVTATPSFTDTVLVNARAGYARSYLYNSTASRGIYQVAGDVSGPYWELGGVTGAIGAETLSSYLVISSNAKSLQFAQVDWGLKLPATPANADTQTLDCYQENTWTPTLTAFDGTAPTATVAKYTRIGRMVYFEIVLNATGGANFGATWGATKVSLPITPANTIAIPINRNSISSCGATSGSDILLTTYAQSAETIRITGFFSV